MAVDKTTKQFKNGVREERKEHPWMTTEQLERLVSNHLSKHPYMYLG